MNLKIKITLENKRRLRLLKCERARLWCPFCAEETDFISENELAEILENLFETQKVHKISTGEGLHLICLQSLVNN